MAIKYAILEHTITTYTNESRIVPEYYDTGEEAKQSMARLLEEMLERWRSWYAKYGGDSSCIEVRNCGGSASIKDAGGCVEWRIQVLHPSRRETETA